MKNIIILIVTLVSISSFAEEVNAGNKKVVQKKVQQKVAPRTIASTPETQDNAQWVVGLGYSSQKIESASLSESLTTPVLVGGIQSLSTSSGDIEGGLMAELGYMKSGNKTLMQANVRLEVGTRFIFGKFSIAPKAALGGGYLSYENSQFSLVQINEVKGGVFQFGALINAQYQLSSKLVLGAKVEYTRTVINAMSDSKMTAITPSLSLGFSF